MHYLTEEEAAVVWEHFPEITDEMKNYATNIALSQSRYIFVEKLSETEKNVFESYEAKAYCTSCKSSFFLDVPLKQVKQNAETICPHCQRGAFYKKSWIGYKHLVDQAAFIWFDKSPVDEQMITARGVFCERKYGGDYKNVETKCRDTVIYTFKIGESAMYNTWGQKKLEKRKSIYTNQTSLEFYFAVESLKKAVVGTPFEFSVWEEFYPSEHLKYLDLFSKHPNVETLVKNGFKGLVNKYMHGASMHGAINWNARKLHEFFKLPKDEFKRLSETEATGQYVMYAPQFAFGLRVWQLALKENSKMTYEELMNACNMLHLSDHKERFNKVRKYSTIHRAINYIKRQFELHSNHYNLPSQVIIAWSDYIAECMDLNYDLQNDVVLYPKNLRKAHETTSKLVRVKKNELANKRIKKRVKELEHLIFAADGFEIRPPATFEEIVDEGKALAHCVARYADEHSRGKCTLMLVRQLSAPDKPFYTVELNIRSKKLVQVRGHRNKAATKEVQRFMDKFELLLQQEEKKARKRA